MRNIIIGCDGTWHDDLDPNKRTNVFKLLKACAGKNQVPIYQEGVGTAFGESLPGGAGGFKIDRQILDAYFELSREFQHPDWARSQQRIFIFGFSRGAYAARVLAGLIDYAGIPAVPKDYKKGWNAFRNQDKDAATKLKDDGRFFEVPIEVLGVWDTVKSTILLPDLGERRVWFPGVHSDIGGGYKESGLSSITLKWMIRNAAKHKLAFKKSAVDAINPEPNDKLHDSYQGAWKALGKRTRKIEANALVHDSVQKRNDYKPSNVPDSVTYVPR